ETTAARPLGRGNPLRFDRFGQLRQFFFNEVAIFFLIVARKIVLGRDFAINDRNLFDRTAIFVYKSAEAGLLKAFRPDQHIRLLIVLTLPAVEHFLGVFSAERVHAVDD